MSWLLCDQFHGDRTVSQTPPQSTSTGGKEGRRGFWWKAFLRGQGGKKNKENKNLRTPPHPLQWPPGWRPPEQPGSVWSHALTFHGFLWCAPSHPPSKGPSCSPSLFLPPFRCGGGTLTLFQSFLFASLLSNKDSCPDKRFLLVTPSCGQGRLLLKF